MTNYGYFSIKILGSIEKISSLLENMKHFLRVRSGCTSATRQPWGSMSSWTSCLSLSKKSSNFRNLRAHRPRWSRQNTASSSSRALREEDDHHLWHLRPRIPLLCAPSSPNLAHPLQLQGEALVPGVEATWLPGCLPHHCVIQLEHSANLTCNGGGGGSQEMLGLGEYLLYLTKEILSFSSIIFCYAIFHIKALWLIFVYNTKEESKFTLIL